MSRLQVGGLALTIDSSISKHNTGLVVVITKIMLNRYGDGIDWYRCENENLIGMGGKVIGWGNFTRKKLMPIGDKQTQDELAKEKELDNV